MYHFRNYLCLLLLLLLVGCSVNNEAADTNNKTEASNHPSLSITDFSDRTIGFQHHPEKIVSLGNGETDIVYALEGKVVGRPTGETVIKEAENALEVGSTHSVDLEKITSLEPDVVLGNHPMNSKDIQAIESIGAEMVLTSANSVDDITRQIMLLGDLLGQKEKAEELIHTINEKIKDLQKRSFENKPRVLLIYGAPGTNMAALPNSLGGNILELAGGINIASDYPSLEQYPQYAQLNTERIIEANPEIILLMSHGNPEEVKDSFIQDMSKNAGWSDLDAVKNNQFHILPSNLFGTNPGTKVIDALDYMYELLEDVNK
ncbi:ABC transporter substrate-binding protein [Pseudogracilibacillus sp. SE30717A]|uniref:ABC transporter substrate-binding protein n=1 Tax=Pseudogracilibacillus sp. SE30717A TaxID=3098293 RepID=UPI00300E05AA